MKRIPMDVTVTWGKEPMARLAMGVIHFKAQITDSFTMQRPLKPREHVYLRIQIPEESVEAFREFVKPKEMKHPPSVQLGWEFP